MKIEEFYIGNVRIVYTLGRGQSKTPILSGKVDQKSIETVFLIAICRLTGDKWQSKTRFLSIFDPPSTIVDYVFDCRLPGVVHKIVILYSQGQQPPKVDHNHVLEHSLHQLLREVHYKSLHMSPPHPVTSTLGVTKRRRIAGPAGSSRADLKEMSES